jgi:hypothetical protein
MNVSSHNYTRPIHLRKLVELGLSQYQRRMIDANKQTYQLQSKMTSDVTLLTLIGNIR